MGLHGNHPCAKWLLFVATVTVTVTNGRDHSGVSTSVLQCGLGKILVPPGAHAHCSRLASLDEARSVHSE